MATNAPKNFKPLLSTWKRIGFSDLEYSQTQVIGSGCFGVIHRVRPITSKSIFSGIKLAVKVVKKVRSNDLMNFGLLNDFTETKFLNIVTVYKIIQQAQKYFVIMELCHKNLKQIMISQPEDLCCEQIYEYLKDIVNGITELKDSGYLHRDIKPQNIVISEQGTAKLCDFDFVTKQPSNNHSLSELSKNSSKIGTLSYMAPQVLTKGQSSVKSDLWSLGILLFELFFRKSPFFDHSYTIKMEQKQYKQIVDNYEKITEYIFHFKENTKSQRQILLCEIMLKTIKISAQKRISLEELKFIFSQKEMNQIKGNQNLFKELTPTRSCKEHFLLKGLGLLVKIVNKFPKSMREYKKNRDLLEFIDQYEKFNDVQLQKFHLIEFQIFKEINKGINRLQKSLKFITTQEQQDSSNKQFQLLSAFKEVKKIIKRVNPEIL